MENETAQVVVPTQTIEAPKGVTAPPKRQIIIETDGDNVYVVKAEVSGKIELAAIMQLIADSIRVEKK